MGIDADFRFNIPTDADFPDDVTIERDDGETREYVHPGILREADKELQAALDGQDQYREQCRKLSAENNSFCERTCNAENKLADAETKIKSLAAENRALRSAFASLRDQLTEVSVQAEDAVIAINMDSVSGRRDLSTDRQPIDSDTSCKWVEVDEYDCTTWETDCGRKWEFMADGPVENDIKYCHGCGKPIQLSAPDGSQ